jgi:hypothetical protein
LGVSLEDLSSMTISNSNVLLARNSNEWVRLDREIRETT